MNAANLQLEGLLMAVAGVNQALVAKGLLTTEEIDHSLAVAEQTALGDDRVTEDLSPANRDAIVFPIRLLRLATIWPEIGMFHRSLNSHGWWVKPKSPTTTSANAFTDAVSSAG